nr:hypothetical protein GCM10020185_16910 [Pseudomonas brassicacearum subsp. brassicacearum]
MVPMLGGQFSQGGRGQVDRVLRQVWISHVTLLAAHGQLRAEGTAPAILDHVAHQRGARRFADDAPVQSFLTGLEAFDHGFGAVVGRAFFIAGNQEGQ